jgi:DNA-binding HxlR family transcriptional regulator
MDPTPLAWAAEQIGDRWTLLLVEALMAGPRRFNELSEALEGIAPNVLSQRLKHLEAQALVVARPYSRRPPRMAYELTADGLELAGVLRLLAHWGARRGGGDRAPRHGICGSPLETRWYCPTCDLVVPDEEDAAELRFL